MKFQLSIHTRNLLFFSFTISVKDDVMCVFINNKKNFPIVWIYLKELGILLVLIQYTRFGEPKRKITFFVYAY